MIVDLNLACVVAQLEALIPVACEGRAGDLVRHLSRLVDHGSSASKQELDNIS